MKKLVLTLLLSIISLTSVLGQVYKSTHQIKNGLKQLVPVTLSIDITSSPVNYDEIIQNRREAMLISTAQNDINSIDSDGNIADSVVLENILIRISALTQVFVVKNYATWVPNEVFLKWDGDSNCFIGYMMGFASNSYGTPGIIRDNITMNINGYNYNDYSK
tara:strand:+ start:75 stop:560 length:486 start_codon:yes stop_codon:yes gene_type:complete